MYGFDPDLLQAIAHVESNGNSKAVSPKGAQGLMQLMPATAAQYGVSDPFDPIDNALGAARFLNHLRHWRLTHPELDIHLPEILAAYNAGEGAVEKFGGIPPYPETEQYVREVLLRYFLDPSTTLKLSCETVRIGFRSAPNHNLSTAESASRPVPHVDALDQLSEIKRMRAQAQQRHKLYLSRPDAKEKN
jgi:hypothetical protein